VTNNIHSFAIAIG